MSEELREVVEKAFGIRLYNYQLKFLDDCITDERVCARMCRQVGKSMTLAIYAVLFACSNPDSHTLVIAPTDKQAGIIFDKVKGFLSHINTEKAGILESSTQRSCILKNRSKIEALTTGDDGLTVRGHTAHLLIIDESAFVKQKIYNEVLLPTVIATKGKIIEISTPFGRNNHFFEHCIKSKHWIAHHVPWQVALEEGHLTQKNIDDARSTMTKMQFETEMGAEFVDDQRNYFKLAVIQACIEDYPLITEADLG